MFPFVQALAGTITAANLAGRSRVIKNAVKGGTKLPSDKQLEKFADEVPNEIIKKYVKDEPFLKTEPDIKDLARTSERQAWEIAREFRKNLVAQIQDHIITAQTESIGSKDFVSYIKKLFAGQELSKAHLETVYRTNIQTAYYTGYKKELASPLMRQEFPYQEYYAVDDDRVRSNHLAMSGVWAPMGHPVWNKWTPPNGFNCRCSLRAIHRDEAEARGLDNKTPIIPNIEPDPGFGV